MYQVLSKMNVKLWQQREIELAKVAAEEAKEKAKIASEEAKEKAKIA